MAVSVPRLTRVPAELRPFGYMLNVPEVPVGVATSAPMSSVLPLQNPTLGVVL